MKADYPWQELYEAAILETDDAKLLRRLPEAKASIADRPWRYLGRTAGHQRCSCWSECVTERFANALSGNRIEQSLNAADQHFGGFMFRHYSSNARR